jgi:hypothetical protein
MEVETLVETLPPSGPICSVLSLVSIFSVFSLVTLS